MFQSQLEVWKAATLVEDIFLFQVCEKLAQSDAFGRETPEASGRAWRAPNRLGCVELGEMNRTQGRLILLPAGSL